MSHFIFLPNFNKEPGFVYDQLFQGIKTSIIVVFNFIFPQLKRGKTNKGPGYETK